MHFVIALLASIIGAICGIGGGVIIKPVLDVLTNDGAAAINFMSGCTVFAMSLYSIGKELLKKKSTFDYGALVPLSIGAAIGGVLGNQLFKIVKGMFENVNRVSGIQSICLAIVVFISLLYTINKSKIKEHHVEDKKIILLIGLALGMMSSFLGIGGGPINLVVLYYFFSYTTKQAALASIFVILCGQITNLGVTVLSGSVPAFNPLTLVLMIIGGIAGGIIGRSINSKIDDKTVEKLFIGIMVVIIAICLFNIYKYFILA